MKKLFIKFFDKIILLLLGFSGIMYSCYEYGMPVDEYEIKGVITDKTSKSIPNIRVIKQERGNIADTMFTSLQGKYGFSFWHSNEVHLIIDDIDGVENGGEFESEELDVQFTDADLVKKGRGNKKPDRYSKTLNVELERKSIFIPMYGVAPPPFEP